MFKATQAIYQALKQEDGLKVFTDETEHTSRVWLQFSIKNGGSYRISFINSDDDSDTEIRVYSLISADEEHRSKLLPVLNKLNCQYRFVKFTCDDDGDVNLEYDYPIRSNPATSAMEMVIRIVKIIDQAYPELMRVMWN